MYGKFLFSTLVLGMLSLSLGAQQTNAATEQSIRDNFNLGAFRVSNSRIMYGLAEAPGKLLGEIYLDTAFNPSTVYFYSEIIKSYDTKAADSVSGYPLRLDLREHVAEFLVGNTVKGVEYRAVRKIVYQSARSNRPTMLINSREFTARPEQVFGYVQQLAAGDVEVYKFPALKIRKPNYSPALVSGDKNAYYYQQPIYLYRDARNALIPFKAKNKKALLEVLSKRRAEVEAFMDKSGLVLKTEEDLIQILDFYNKNVFL